MAALCQQILAGDAKYNAYRAPNNPQFRTLYIRRRSQLLREKSTNNTNCMMRRDYLKLRTQLLTSRYGTPLYSDAGSLRSRTISLRSVSRNTAENSYDSSPFGSGKHFRHITSSSLKQIYDSIDLTPTSFAEASRAMAGGKTVSENYAFAGMHHIFDQHTAAVTSVKFANDDKTRIACSSVDETLSICQLIPPPATVICMLRAHTGAVTDFAWTISNDNLLSVSLDGRAILWDVAAGEPLRTISDSTEAEILCCRFQPLNNNIFVTGNSKCYVHVINMSTGKDCKGGSSKVTGRVLSLAFDPSGHVLWSGDDKGYIYSFLFDIATGKLTKAKRVTMCEGHSITSISSRSWISREARDPSLLVNTSVNALCLFRIVTEDGGLQLRHKYPVKQKTQNIRSAFCPLMSFRQGACVISGSEDMCVYFYDVTKDGKKACVNKLLGHSAPVIDVCFNCDESLLASCDAQGLVIVWKREGKQSVL